MCGINGAFAFSANAAPLDRDEVIRVRDSMQKRGPDGSGAWFSPDGRAGLGHRRLAIIDLSDRAAQPMPTEDGQYVIVFNGEIYNYREIRQALERQGVRFRTHSDTEVVLQLYRLRGAAMLSELRGMFAVCIWDCRSRSLFLARDPYGIKPLYFANDGATFRFASRVKPLLQSGRVSHALDPAGQASFFLRGCVMQPFTTYEAVHSIPAGSYMTVDEAGPSAAVKYFSIAAILRDAVQRDERLSADEQQELVTEAVEESVRYHLVADVDIGAFLSGGKDSTAIVAHASAAADRPLHTINVAFDEYRGTRNDESAAAALVAGACGTRHVTRWFGKEEFKSILPAFLDAMDQPSVDAINTFIVSKAAAELGLKVAISGTGGDELFGGYSTFTKIPRTVRRTALLSQLPGLPKAYRWLYTAMMPSDRRISARSAGVLEYGGTYPGAYLLRRGLFMPWELGSLMGRGAAEEGLRRLSLIELIGAEMEPDPLTPFARIAALDSCLYMRDQLLADIDWASMAHSLEIRVPLVDAFFLKKVARAVLCAAGDRKNLLARSPRRPLPTEILSLPKRGFTVPIREWLIEDDPDVAKKFYGFRLWAKRIWGWTSDGWPAAA